MWYYYGCNGRLYGKCFIKKRLYVEDVFKTQYRYASQSTVNLFLVFVGICRWHHPTFSAASE